MIKRFGLLCAIIFVVGIGLYFLGFRMSRDDVHISAKAEPIYCVGTGWPISADACAPGTLFPITNGISTVIIADIVVLLVVFLATRNMQLVPRGLQNVMEYIVEAFYNFARGIDAANVRKFFPLTMTIFLFLLAANFTALLPGYLAIGNCMPIKHGAEDAAHSETAMRTMFQQLPGACPEGTYVIPWLRAAAADLNMPLALAVVSMIMIQIFGFQALGSGYLTKFFNFNGFKVGILQGLLDVFIGLMELISEISRVLSFAFRLFGNIFAGEVILIVFAFLFPYILPLPFWGFELFVAFMQAFIFSTLVLVFMSLATQSHDGHGDAHNHGSSLEDKRTPIEAPTSRETVYV